MGQKQTLLRQPGSGQGLCVRRGGFAVTLVRRAGLAPCARLSVPPGRGQPGSAWSPALLWAAAAGCCSCLGISFFLEMN